MFSELVQVQIMESRKLCRDFLKPCKFCLIQLKKQTTIDVKINLRINIFYGGKNKSLEKLISFRFTVFQMHTLVCPTL